MLTKKYLISPLFILFSPNTNNSGKITVYKTFASRCRMLSEKCFYKLPVFFIVVRLTRF